jgi:hypothetical protein
MRSCGHRGSVSELSKLCDEATTTVSQSFRSHQMRTEDVLVAVHKRGGIKDVAELPDAFRLSCWLAVFLA